MSKFWQQLIDYFKKHRRIFLILFFTALSLRSFYFITHLSFTQDQVRDVLFIKDRLEKHNFYIPLGPAAASYSNFNILPFYYYLQLAAHLLFFNSFYSMNVLILLLESCSPILLYYLLSRTGLKSKLCFLGGLLYAFTPAAISLAANAWNPNLIPFFTFILLISGLWFVLDNRQEGLVISCLAVIIMTGLHFQWFVFLPFIIVIAFKALWQIRTTWKTILVTLFISCFFLFPYFYSETTNNYQNFYHSLAFLTQGPIIFERISKPNYLLFFLPNYYNRLFFSTSFVYSWTWLYETYTGPELKLLINSFCFWSIFAFNFWIIYRRRDQHSSRWLGSTLFIFISMAIFLRFYKGDKPDYFLNVFMPFIFIWLMQAISYLRSRKMKIAIIVLIVFIGNFILWTQPRYNQYHDYQVIASKVKQADQNREIIILNQELEGPIRYFLNDETFSATPSSNLANTIFLCHTAQACSSYQPNAPSSSNIFKYDWVTSVNYGITFEHYNYLKSERWKTPTLEGFLVVNKTD